MLRFALWATFGIAILGFASTFALEASFEGRAQKVQIVKIDTSQHSPFGPVTSDVGDPTMMIVDDPSAFLKNRTATGLPMLDAGKLEASGALKLETAQSVVTLARSGCVLAAIVTLAGLVLLGRFRGFVVPPPE